MSVEFEEFQDDTSPRAASRSVLIDPNNSETTPLITTGIDETSSTNIKVHYSADTLLDTNSSRHDNIVDNDNRRENEIENSVGGHGVATAGNCTFGETVFNTLNYDLGGCFLAIPYAFRLAGFSGIIATLAICVSTFYTALLLVNICTHFPHVQNYYDMVRAILGKKGGLVAGFFMWYDLYLGIVLFFILAGEILSQSGYLQLMHAQDTSMTVCTVIMVVLIYPTTYLSNLKPLAKLSTVGLSAILITFCVVYVEFAKYYGTRYDYTFFTSFLELGYGIGTICGAYNIHCMIPTLKTSMKDPSQFRSVIIVSYIIILICMLSVGIAGYVAYGQSTHEAISSNFNGYFDYVASGLLLIKVWSYPALGLYPITSDLLEHFKSASWCNGGEAITDSNNGAVSASSEHDEIVALVDGTTVENKDKDMELDSIGSRFANFRCQFRIGDFTKRVITNTLLVLVALILAICVPSVSLITSFYGATCALALAVVFPCVMYIVFVWRRMQSGESGKYQGHDMMMLITTACVLTFMSFVCIWSLYCEFYFATNVY